MYIYYVYIYISIKAQIYMFAPLSYGYPMVILWLSYGAGR